MLIIKSKIIKERGAFKDIYNSYKVVIVKT
jgi:hypothetical protein